MSNELIILKIETHNFGTLCVEISGVGTISAVKSAKNRADNIIKNGFSNIQPYGENQLEYSYYPPQEIKKIYFIVDSDKKE